MTLKVKPPVSPMLAKLAREMPVGDQWAYEPKWDGFRCIVFRDGKDIELGSRNERPLTRYFPDLVEPLLAALPDGAVVDGEIVIKTPDGLGLRPAVAADPSRREPGRDARRGHAGRRSWPSTCSRKGSGPARAPVRRASGRARSGARSDRPQVHLTPITRDPEKAREWFDTFEGAGLDGVVAKDLTGEYKEGERGWLKVKHLRTADCVVAGFRTHKDGKGVGSLLLGLYNDDGKLQHVGVASSFNAARRAGARRRARGRTAPTA